ncbi:MAG: nucleoside deaminase [Oscillospiraceae bacterium]|nr:nucleoside deaminase [Oscillospiraceae bacterium]
MEIREFDRRFAAITHEKDLELLRRTFELAKEGRASGNNPFGALLADGEGNILIEQANIEVTTRDCTGHAETTVARKASMTYDKDFLWNCTLYTSAEPCCMCTGAIYWANIGRIVFAMSENMLFQTTGDNEANPSFNHSCREILSKGQKEIVVRGPFPEIMEEALEPHKGFWD